MLVCIPKDIKEVLYAMISKIEDNIHFTRIVLYGSYSNGTYNSQSDLDIAFFIKDNSIKIIEAYRYVQKICMIYDLDIQPQIFYEKEFKNPHGIVEEILKNGIEITNFVSRV